MHNKKKVAGPRRPTAKKKTPKVSHEASQTIVTTKEKTFATIQQTNQGLDHKTSTRTTHFTSKRETRDRFEDNNLSPFSNPRQSTSPPLHRSLTPNVVKQKQRKTGKKTIGVQTQYLRKRNAVPGHSMITGAKTPKAKDKNTKRAKAEFQNEFIKRMSKGDTLQQKKITELSEEEMEGSLKKQRRAMPMIEPRQEEWASRMQSKSKRDTIRSMHTKIKQKYYRMYPNLGCSEMKILTALVLVQRLWRQQKVKHMIGKFLAPPSAQSSQKQFITWSSEAQKPCSVPWVHTPEPKKECTLHTTPVSKSLNLQDLELSDQFSSPSPAKAGTMRQYVHMYRELTLMSKKKQAQKSKTNAFNFPSSLSDKCLLQKLYRKSVSKCPKIDKQDISASTQLFLLPHRSSEKFQEQYLSPKKLEAVELEERFYTEARDEEFAQVNPTPVKPEEQTVGSIGQIAETIINTIITEFSQEFFAFGQRKCLKRKRRLPGIPINESTISIYLQNYLDFIDRNYSSRIGQSMSAVAAPSYLKIFRPTTQESLFESGCLSNSSEEEEEEFNRPVLPHCAFFEYQPVYEQQIFQIKQEDSKYTNFLLGLIKIHNKCLADCLSELIEKSRIDSIKLPWDCSCPLAQSNPSSISTQTHQVKQRILKISATKLGRLSQRDTDCQEVSLLLSCKEDYKREGKDWDYYAELLEVRLQLTEALLLSLYDQAVKEISWGWGS